MEIEAAAQSGPQTPVAGDSVAAISPAGATTFPFLTCALIVVLVAVFGLELGSAPRRRQVFFSARAFARCDRLVR